MRSSSTATGAEYRVSEGGMTHATLPSGELGDQSSSRQLRPPTGENERNYVKRINPDSHGGLGSGSTLHPSFGACFRHRRREQRVSV